jgi:hypothetical protein
MTVLIFNAPTLQIYNGAPMKKYGKNPMERILFSCKTRIMVPKRESLLWSCSFVVSSFDIDAALKMVTTRSQIAERRAEIVPRTNAQQKKKKMKKKKMKKTATEKKTGKKTDNKDNKTDDLKAWGDFVQIKEFFLLKKEFTVLWSDNRVCDHAMTVVLQDWPTQALEVLFALNLYDREVKKMDSKIQDCKAVCQRKQKILGYMGRNW